MVQEYVIQDEAAPLIEPQAEHARTSGAAVTWARDSILFSSCNEDSGSELRALGDLENKRVLCITAGGGRVLNLLVGQPKTLWAVDLNPAQNFLLELKVEGMRALDHGAYLRFLGVRDASDRVATYRSIRGQLTLDAQLFFDAHLPAIRSGILFEGRLERFLRKLSKVLRWTGPLGVQRLFDCEDIVQQRQWLSLLERPLFRAIAENGCRRSVLAAFSGDPGFYRYVPREVALHRVIYGGILEHFRHHLARDNPLMQLVFFGRVVHESALPVYLNAATYERVRAALQRVELIRFTGTINQAFAQAGVRSFDALSLSDISSYLDDAAHDQLFADALASAKPGAMLCSRSNIHHRPLRPEHEARLTRSRSLERELAISDHSCVHEFIVGKVR